MKNLLKFQRVVDGFVVFFVLFSRMCCIFDMLFAINGAAVWRKGKTETECIGCIGTGMDRFDQHDIGHARLPYVYIKNAKYNTLKLIYLLFRIMHID